MKLNYYFYFLKIIICRYFKTPFAVLHVYLFCAFPSYICFSNYNPTSLHKLIRRFTDALKILKLIELVHFLLF